jgi:hypothetical protein
VRRQGAIPDDRAEAVALIIVFGARALRSSMARITARPPRCRCHATTIFRSDNADSREQKTGPPTVSQHIERCGHGWRFTRRRADHGDVSDLRSLGVGANARMTAPLPATMHRRCIPAALAMSAWRRPAYGQWAAPASFVGSISPVVIECRCLAGLHGFTPSRLRQGTPTSPHSHSTAQLGGQDKSREVRPGWMAAERGNVSDLARCALFGPACVFGERKEDQYSAHLTRNRIRPASGREGRSVAPRRFRPFGSALA